MNIERTLNIEHWILNSAETEEQQPNWGDVQEWGELYDLEADPQVE